MQTLTGLIAPPTCVLCGGPGRHLDEPWGLDLCLHCEAACPRAPAASATLVAPFLYAPPVNTLITRLKFGHELAAARVLGMLFARHRRALAAPLPECIVPMPLHAGRLRERGFNQCEEIARHLAPRLRLRVNTQLLVRTRATEAQSSLAADARARNVAGAFVLHPPAAMPGHVALLDDVMTTGSTLAAATAVLRQGGVQRVDAWVLARTPRHDDAVSARQGL